MSDPKRSAIWEPAARREDASDDAHCRTRYEAGRCAALEAELQQQHEQTTAILRSMADAVFATDAATHVTQMNPEAERLTGIPAARAIGRPLDAVLRLVDVTSHQPVPDLVGEVPYGILQLASLSNAKVIHPDGRARFVSVSSAPLLGHGGERSGTVLILRDLTERLELERRAEIAEHLAAIGTLATGIAHEINSPLTYALGNVDLGRRLLARMVASVDDALPDPRGDVLREIGERLDRCLANAADGAQRIRIIASDLRTLGRPASSASSPTDAREVVQAALRITMGELSQRARVVERLEPTAPVEASPTRLGQVVINLLVNAAQALPEPRREDARIEVRSGSDGPDTTYIEIEDNGSGIPALHLPHVFDRFYTTKPADEGTGLGLTICDRIVRDLGGRIELTSQEGRGTKVRVYLPSTRRSDETPATDPEDSTVARSLR